MHRELAGVQVPSGSTSGLGNGGLGGTLGRHTKTQIEEDLKKY